MGNIPPDVFPALPDGPDPMVQTDAPTMTDPEIVEVTDRSVSCDGGGGALGHPKVYLNMGSENFVECPYCDRRFVLKQDHP